MHAIYVTTALALQLALPAVAQTPAASPIVEDSILEFVFAGRYNRGGASSVSVQVVSEKQPVNFKYGDVQIAKFAITPIGPCVALVAMDADELHEKRPAAWPVQVTPGSTLYLSRQIGRHLFELDVTVVGYGNCAAKDLDT